jgi:hypothetical protein
MHQNAWVRRSKKKVKAITLTTSDAAHQCRHRCSERLGRSLVLVLKKPVTRLSKIAREQLRV